MNKYKLFLLTLILFLAKIAAFSQCAGCTFTIAGNDAGTYTLHAGDVMCISSTGNFTGTVNLAGGILCNEGIYNGSTNNNSGSTIENYGTMSVSGAFFFSGFTVNNHNGGTFNYSNGGFSGATLNNGGQFNYDGNLSVSNTSIDNTGNINTVGSFATSGNFTNSGTITAGTTYRLNAVGSMTNSGTINAVTVETNDDFTTSGTVNTSSSFVVNGGTTTNTGTIDSQGTVIHNNGTFNNDNYIHATTTFTNNDELHNTDLIVVDGEFINNDPLTNSGCVDAKTNFTNNSTLTNNATLKIAGNFVNNHVLNNNLYIGVTGDFRNDGSSFSGTVAPPYARIDIGGESRNNSTITGFLDFNDTSTPGSIDVDFGTINANVAFGIAHTAGITILPCTVIILPIDLLSFDAKVKGDFVEVDWATVSETNNDFFTVECSKNGIEWVKVSTIAASSTPNSVSNYTILDKEPYLGISYYRLKQTDFDGQFTYSQIVAVEMNTHSEKEVKIYPNPSTNQLKLVGNPLEIGNFRIFNALGQNLSNKIKIRSKELSAYIIDISALPTGVYTLKTQTRTLRFYKE